MATAPTGPYSQSNYNTYALDAYASMYGLNPSQVQYTPGQGYSLAGTGPAAPAPQYVSPTPQATGGGVAPSGMNSMYYATPGTAQQIAGLVGGTVAPYNMSPPGGGGIQIPPAQGVNVGGQTFDAGVLANLTTRGYSPYSLSQQFNTQSGGAINVSPSAVASYMGAPSSSAAPVPGGAGWLPGNVAPAGPPAQYGAAVPASNPTGGATPKPAGATSTAPGAAALPGAAAGTTTGATTGGATTPSGAPPPPSGFSVPTSSIINPFAGSPSMYTNPTGVMPGGGISSPFTGTWAPQSMPPGTAGGGGTNMNYGGPDQFLSGLARGGMGGLQSIVSGGGNPISSMPAWQSMVDAQQRQLQENASNLRESLNMSGNLGGSAANTQLTDYWNQANLQQNALLAQMQQSSLENAQQRMLSASGQLGQFGYGAGGQLSSQNFQSQMLQQQQALQAALAMGGYSNQAAQAMAGYSYGGAQNLLQNANQATMAMYGGQMAAMPQFMNQDYMNQQLALQMGLGASTNWGQNLLTGAQLGGQQYGLNQQALTNQYNQWLYQQPQYNPFVQQAYQLGTYYPTPTMPSYAPGWFGSALGAAGGAAGGLLGNPGIFASDVRIKENVVPIGEINRVPFYKYNFKGDSTPRFGPVAQEVERIIPEAVIKGDPWVIKLDKFMDHILGGTQWAGSQPLNSQV